MIRAEKVTLAATRGDPQLRQVWGFAWNPDDPDNQVTEFNVVRVEVEYLLGWEEISRMILDRLERWGRP